MLIHVTKEHIKQGQPSECARCPIALALHDVFKCKVFITFETPRWIPVIAFECCGSNISIPLPPIVEAFLDRFDAGKRCRPFTFDLAVY